MRYKPYGKKRTISVVAAVKFVSFTFFFGTLIFCGFFTGSFLISYVTSSLNTIHPTSIPGIKDQENCEATDRVWRDNKCWDYEHNPAF
ncbi:hypothetical protein [Anabaena sp. UHCC 0204]|uniref:hypothetical protein n=1 Tax=Anabaena sp. UHCC 0204 TaxID=2590009 RepID=UPI0014481FA6|nr:hypothetical protein [Anabaena sp. UHCC 0204]MTJ08829.1 hypothetical protein [Anabaena sp. UHCC 0204]